MQDLEYLVKRAFISAKIASIGLLCAAYSIPYALFRLIKPEKEEGIDRNFLITDQEIWETEVLGDTPYSTPVFKHNSGKYLYEYSEFGPIIIGKITNVEELERHHKISFIPYSELDKNTRLELDNLTVKNKSNF